MEANELMEIMKGLLYANGIRMTIRERGTSPSPDIDYRFRETFFPNFDYSQLGENIYRLITPEVLYHFQDDLGLYYSIFCFKEQESIPDRVMILGPFMTHPMSTSEVQSIIQEKHISQNMAASVMEFYNRIPLVPSYDFWSNSVFYLVSQIVGRPVEYLHVTNSEIQLFQSSFSDYHIPDEYETTWKNIEERYQWEHNFMEAVSKGDITAAATAHSHFLKYRITPRVPDPVRNRKNMSIILNTLLRKAVQAGGVHPLHIDHLSTRFAIQIENCFSVEQLNVLSKDMVRKYCLLEQNYSHSSYSTLVKNCVDYIDFHFAEEITLHSLAERFAVSDSYLSRLFKQETGTVVIDYLNRARVKESLFLLKRNELSITEIALRCGFSSSTYFSRVFRKIQGMTPKTYQKSVIKSK